ncbi:MAG: hypothetical protein U5K51_05790 [Flavobacteriaceae bacterium]|nr:hypothetical protein [Flavobacteriaceae bacterium]
MILLSCGLMPVFGQQSTIDSLKGSLSLNNKDTTLVAGLNTLALELIQNENYAEGIAYANQSLDLSTELKFIRKGQSIKISGYGSLLSGGISRGF